MNKHQRDSLSDCLSRVFGRVDDEFIEAAIPRLEWIDLAGGETLFHESDAENGAYFVISGRLRASVQQEGRPRVIGEIARGETVGEMAVLSGEPRSATVTAIRDTVLAHITSESFKVLMHDHPQLAIQMARMTISRLRRDTRRVEARRPATMCMLAVTDGVDLARDRTPRYEHDEIPGWWTLLRDRFRPRERRRHQLPGLGMMLMGSTLLHSESRRKQARSSVDVYFNPDLRQIGLLDWNAFDRIVEIGYLHAREVLSRMSTEELAPYRDT